MKDIKYQKYAKREILESGIYHNYNWYIFDLGTHPTAYIEISNDDILYNKSYWEINDKYDIDVHGGLTYSDSDLFVDKSNRWYIGWDYAHDGDRFGIDISGKNWTSLEIYEDICRVIQQIEVINNKNKEDNLLHISNTLENILYVLERIEKKIYEEKN